jgi:hypothetical protein
VQYTTIKPSFKLICYRLSSVSRIRQQYREYYESLNSFNLGTMLMGAGLVTLMWTMIVLAYFPGLGTFGRVVCAVLLLMGGVPLYPWHVISRDAEVDELPYL